MPHDGAREAVGNPVTCRSRLSGSGLVRRGLLIGCPLRWNTHGISWPVAYSPSLGPSRCRAERERKVDTAGLARQIDDPVCRSRRVHSRYQLYLHSSRAQRKGDRYLCGLGWHVGGKENENVVSV